MESRSVADLVSYRVLVSILAWRVVTVLSCSFSKKGATADIHIRGDKRVIEAGIELSEYIMPGLGGREGVEEATQDTMKRFI